MRIVLYVEGETERAFRNPLKAFLDGEAGERPRVRLDVRKGVPVTKLAPLVRDMERDLARPDCRGVVVLVDVYPHFASADEARAHYATCGPKARFRAHCALHDFEAWLLPYWERIHRLAGKVPPKGCPWGVPESVNRVRPPSKVLADLFPAGNAYRKTLHAPRILEGQDLRVAAEACPQLKAFLSTLLEFAGYDTRL